jgi:hypothetical protein
VELTGLVAALRAGRWVALVLLSGSPAAAHGMRTAYVDITEQGSGRLSVHIRRSVPAPAVRVRPPAGCREVASAAGDTFDSFATWECDGPTIGKEIAVEGLGPVLSDAVVDVTLADGRTVSQLLRPGGESWVVPAVETPLTVARGYFKLGVNHILTGWDHLLFLALLVLAVQRPRAVLLAESAFTLSHSASFAASALGWIRVSSAAAEACIALSLLLLALDVGRPGAPALPAWKGAGMALVFGLVHGLGFAGGLREIGLPEHSIPWALVSFGAGVEAGQVAFLAIALTVFYALSRWRRSAWFWGATWASGAVSAYWLIARLSALFVSAN